MKYQVQDAKVEIDGEVTPEDCAIGERINPLRCAADLMAMRLPRPP